MRYGLERLETQSFASSRTSATASFKTYGAGGLRRLTIASLRPEFLWVEPWTSADRVFESCDFPRLRARLQSLREAFRTPSSTY